jgi:hypothetical protein
MHTSRKDALSNPSIKFPKARLLLEVSIVMVFAAPR